MMTPLGDPALRKPRPSREFNRLGLHRTCKSCIDGSLSSATAPSLNLKHTTPPRTSPHGMREELSFYAPWICMHEAFCDGQRAWPTVHGTPQLLWEETFELVGRRRHRSEPVFETTEDDERDP